MSIGHISPARRYGSLYPVTEGMKIKDIAAQIRKTIRQAAKDGLLPSDWKYSVRYRTASMSQAIDVEVTIPEDLHKLRSAYAEFYGYHYQTSIAKFEDEWSPLAVLADAHSLINEIHRGYNYDGSDAMTDYFDVRYYGGVSFRPESW